MSRVKTASLSHVSLLVASVQAAARRLAAEGHEVGTAREWAEEGVLEMCIGGDHRRGTLLLQQPVATGAYARAMKKRGPGLHHVAVDVARLDDYLEGAARAGWRLHPASRRTIAKTRTAWLSQPGVPALIEVQERKTAASGSGGSSFITRVELPAASAKPGAIEALGAEEIAASDSPDAWLTLGTRRRGIAGML